MTTRLPWLDECARTFSGCQTGGTGIDKCGAISFGVDLFQVDDQLGWVVLSISEYFRAVEGDDMIGDDLDRLITEVRIVDTEVSIEPLNLMGDQLTGDKPLSVREVSTLAWLRVMYAL